MGRYVFKLNYKDEDESHRLLFDDQEYAHKIGEDLISREGFTPDVNPVAKENRVVMKPEENEVYPTVEIERVKVREAPGKRP